MNEYLHNLKTATTAFTLIVTALTAAAAPIVLFALAIAAGAGPIALPIWLLYIPIGAAAPIAVRWLARRPSLKWLTK